LDFAVKVPSTPIIQVSPNIEYINGTGMAPNVDIVTILADVQGDQMMNSIVELSNFYTRHSRSYGAVQAMDYLVDRYTKYGFWTTTFNYASNTSSNVIAELTGVTSPDEIIVVGSHYDSRAQRNANTERAPGADDDASGNSVSLELARLINKFNVKFDRTLRIVAFSGEEQGLLGSAAYASDLRSNNVNVVAMFNGDMLGWKPTGTTSSLGMKRDYINQNLLNSANDITRLYVPELGVGVSTSCCSDYVSFYNEGYSAIGYFQFPGTASAYPYYHRSDDLPDNIDVDLLELEGKAMMASVLTYARIISINK